MEETQKQRRPEVISGLFCVSSFFSEALENTYAVYLILLPAALV